MAEAAEAEVPGARSNIAVKEPPYIPAAYVATINIRAVSGGHSNEIGIIRAIAIGGPRPGIAPTIRPTTIPRNIAPKLATDTTLSKNSRLSIR
jgi:hypothetical protein